jgi:hypothetical protein
MITAGIHFAPKEQNIFREIKRSTRHPAPSIALDRALAPWGGWNNSPPTGPRQTTHQMYLGEMPRFCANL